MLRRIWICTECGEEYGSRVEGLETYHHDICDYCQQVKAVCHVRRYRYPTHPDDMRQENE